MKVNMTNLLCEGNKQILQDICTYWCKQVPKTSEEFETLRSLLKSHYVTIVDKSAEYGLSYVEVMVRQANDFAQVCAEFDQKLEEYIDQLASECRILLNIAEAL